MKIDTSSLVDKKVFPAISIVLPIHPQFPEIKADSEHMFAVFANIEKQLNERYGHEKSGFMLEKVRSVVSGIEANHLLKSLLIYVSPEMEKVISLPFTVVEKVIVDSSFEVRDLLYAAQKNKSYLLVIISQKGVKTFIGDLFKLSYFKDPDMPENVRDVWNEHSFPGLDYLDHKAFEEKNVHNYLRFIDEVLEGSLKQNDYPVIVMGNVKLLGYFRKQTRNAKRIIGYLEGNFEHISVAEIKRKIEPVIEEQFRENEKYAIDMLNNSLSNDNYSSGITEVWRSASEGRGRILLVEKDYCVRARLGNDKFTIIPDDSDINPLNVLSDAVDDVIELVLKNNGDVVFVENDSLKNYQRIALITRY